MERIKKCNDSPETAYGKGRETAMEEKVIISSKNLISGRKLKVFLIVLAALLVILIAYYLVSWLIITPDLEKREYTFRDEHYTFKEWEDYEYRYYYGNWGEWQWDSPENESRYYRMQNTFDTVSRINRIVLYAGSGIMAIFVILLALFLAFLNRITVTDKRVYGTAPIKRRMDLPLDCISSVSNRGIIFKAITVGSASGKIRVRGIKNRNDIHREICNLLMERQNEKCLAEAPAATEAPKNATEELKSFKELLDSGVITQEEFDARKQRVLAL